MVSRKVVQTGRDIELSLDQPVFKMLLHIGKTNRDRRSHFLVYISPSFQSSLKYVTSSGLK